MTNPKQVPRTFALIAGIILLIAGMLLDHFGFHASTEVSVEHNITQSSSVDSQVNIHRNDLDVRVPPAKLESAVAGSRKGEPRNPSVFGQGDVSGNGLSDTTELSDTVVYHILVPRSDTLRSGGQAFDTLDFKERNDTVFNLRIGHAPYTIFVYDTVTTVRDSTLITDSVVTRVVPSLALELETGIHYPNTSIGSLILYGLELSYTRKSWTYALEPYVFINKLGVAFLIKYRIL